MFGITSTFQFGIGFCRFCESRMLWRLLKHAISGWCSEVPQNAKFQNLRFPHLAVVVDTRLSLEASKPQRLKSQSTCGKKLCKKTTKYVFGNRFIYNVGDLEFSLQNMKPKKLLWQILKQTPILKKSQHITCYAKKIWWKSKGRFKRVSSCQGHILPSSA